MVKYGGTLKKIEQMLIHIPIETYIMNENYLILSLNPKEIYFVLKIKESSKDREKVIVLNKFGNIFHFFKNKKEELKAIK